MASSKAKKAEKKKDFQKPKLKVGKAKPKAANHTETSFKAKRITIKQQSLWTDAPTLQTQFAHHVSLLSSSSEVHQKESLSWLESAFSTKTISWSAPDLLDRLLPLLQHQNGAVRSGLIKTLVALPRDNLDLLAEKILLYIWAGMTNINIHIRLSALEVLDWAIETCGIELVTCPGGWCKTLKTYLVMLGWSTIGDSSKWSTNAALAVDTKNIAKALSTLKHFLELGMADEFKVTTTVYMDPIDAALTMHTRPDPYRSLNLFGQSSSLESMSTQDAEHRRALFLEQFRTRFEIGLEEVKKQAGVAGRAAGQSIDVIKKAMKEADGVKAVEDAWAKKMEAKEHRNKQRIWKYGFGPVPHR